MGVVQPIAQTVPAFDSKNENIFKFISKGGNQVVANRLVIRNNLDNEEVYNKKIETYKFEHKLPPNTLVNGNYYNFYFQTYDINKNESFISNIVSFRCYDSPILKITNIPENGVFDNANVTLNINYSQSQGELMDIAKVLLFDELGNKIFESKNIYNDNIPPIDFEYNLIGLEDSKTYQVQVLANTVNRTIVQSKVYKFTTRYFRPQTATLLELTNNCQEGYIELKNNFITIENETNPIDLPNNPEYLYDGKVDLRKNNSYIKYIDGFNIQSDFTGKFFIENPNLGNLITFSNKKGQKIEVNLIKDIPYLEEIEKYCLELKVFNDSEIYYLIYSNFIESADNSLIWIKKINNIYEIILFQNDNQEVKL